jgi:hypothetical protein
LHSTRIIVASLVLAAFLTVSLTSAQATAASTAIVIQSYSTGRLDLTSPAWGTAQSVKTFTNVSKRTVAAEPTIAQIAFNNKDIVVRFSCGQHVPITNNQLSNGVGFGLDDYVGVGIDTSGNGSRVYFFEVTPRGVRYQQSNEASSYDPTWSTRTSQHENDWQAILRIPLSVIRSGATGTSQWRVNFFRYIAQSNETYSWAYDSTMTDSGWPHFEDSRFWPAASSAHVTTTPRVQRVTGLAYVLGSMGSDADTFLMPNGTMIQHRAPLAGGEMRLAVTPTMSALADVNPDFSNVEMDQQTIQPQEFRRVLQEYRPFFAQGANFFQPGALASIYQYPNSIFYSPNIGPFDFGTKLVGTFGFQSVGALNVQAPGLNDTAVFLKHEVQQDRFGWWIGGAEVNHAEGNQSTDPRASKDETFDLGAHTFNPASGLTLGFDETRENGTFTSGLGGQSALGFTSIAKSNYSAQLLYQDVGTEYSPIDGYTNLPDAKGPGFYYDLNAKPHNGFMRSLDLFIAGDKLWDHAGNLHEADLFISPDIVLANQFHVNFTHSYSALRGYNDDVSVVGFPNYVTGGMLPFSQNILAFGLDEASANSLKGQYVWGPYSVVDATGKYVPTIVHQVQVEATRQLRGAVLLDALFQKTDSQDLFAPAETLLRFSASKQMGANALFAVGVREVTGNGPFAPPGTNAFASVKQKITDFGYIYMDYGSPAGQTTLHRFLLKLVFQRGGENGT